MVSVLTLVAYADALNVKYGKYIANYMYSASSFSAWMSIKLA